MSIEPLADPGGVNLQCVTQTAALGENPAGSAGSSDRYVLVELPLPWPAKIDQHPLLAGAKPGPAVAGTTRVLGVSSVGRGEHLRSASDTTRVICYSRTPGASFRAFARSETTVNNTQLSALITKINNGHVHDLEPVIDNNVDVLICTHGSRDRCCGQLGTALFLDLLDQSLDGTLPANVRLWRTSHTGGHRFAPTGMTFPDGMTWAGLTAQRVRSIVNRSLNIDEAATINRGSGGIDGRPAQIADALGFARFGWSWLDAERLTSETIDHTSSANGVIVTVECDLGRGRFTMEDGDPVPVPVCGEPLESSVKATRQIRVTNASWS